MSANRATRKTCLFKGCKQEPNYTHFKFPEEKERFIIWCINAGLDLKGEVDITESRYLCESHFGSNYICSQARRKMLVHTAIPDKWSEEVEIDVDNPGFTVVGSLPDRKRKFREYTLDELAAKPGTIIANQVSPTRYTLLNKQRRTSSRRSGGPSAFQEEVEIQTDDESYQIDTIAPDTYEPLVSPSPPKKQFQYIYVKSSQKPESVIAKMSTTVIPNRKLATLKQETREFEVAEETSYFQEDADISSSIIDPAEEKHVEATPESKKSDVMEGYSEFIFNGEKYVQMPKRVFEAEKEKVRKEAERCKLLLRKLKTHLNNMDLD